MNLTDANITKGSNLVLESGPAPSTNQMTLTFTPGDLRSDLSDLEVTVDKMTTVGDCLQCMILKAGFTDDDWHLQKTNWCGEPAEVLDDLDLTLEMSLVNHGDHLLLVKGKLPPKGFVRIPIWLYPSPRKPFCDSANNTGNGMFSWLTNQIQGLFRSDNKPQDTSITSEEPVYLGDIEVALVMTLEEFKFQILTLPSLSELSLPTQGFLRVTMVESGYLSTVLKGTSQTLQKLKVKSCNRVAVQILDEEENLNVNQMVLYIKQRIPNTKEYLPPVEIIWDTSQGPSINSLEKTIADRLFIPQDHLGMAKHFSKRFDWLIIREGPNKSGGKGKKKAQKTNLRHGPYNLQDGDVIGIKNLQLEYERKEDYCTIEDDQGKIELQKQAEEKKKQNFTKTGFYPTCYKSDASKTVFYCDEQCCSSVFSFISWCSTVFSFILWCSSVLSCILWCSSVLSFILWCSTVFSFILWCSSVLSLYCGVPVCSVYTVVFQCAQFYTVVFSIILLFQCVPCYIVVISVIPVCSVLYCGE
ncbi:USP40 [Mytilus edulis]|uniref:USP40 n=1 Tax=Mytilus edulis TaxID=6550 RepID=A0A8S3R7P1_MYTED|nr:USP40 [Mytilus edulis]